MIIKFFPPVPDFPKNICNVCYNSMCNKLFSTVNGGFVLKCLKANAIPALVRIISRFLACRCSFFLCLYFHYHARKTFPTIELLWNFSSYKCTLSLLKVFIRCAETPCISSNVKSFFFFIKLSYLILITFRNFDFVIFNIK